MKAFGKIGSFLTFLVTIPMYIVIGIAEGWAAAFETHKRRLSVFNLLMYGCPNLGIYKSGLQVVCQRETIWEEDEIFIHNLPSALLRMKVHTWDVRDGKLWIKVCINEQLLKELAEDREEKRIMRNIQARVPDVNTLSEGKENKKNNENEMMNARAEAIKEFAERLKENLDDFYTTGEDALFDTVSAIDEIVKELTEGERKENQEKHTGASA